MKTKLIFLFTLIFTFSANFATAQGCEDSAPPTSKKKSKKSNKSLIVFGYIQPQFTANFNEAKENTFNFKRARLGVRGRISKDFSYYAVLETSDFIKGNKVNLLDAFITYDKNKWARVSLGAFKQPFGRDVTTACHSLTTVERSIAADQLVAPQRDYGLMVLGGSSKTKFRYYLALMNGRGLETADNNKKKDVIGRVTYQLFDFLNLGASFRYGFPNTDEERTSFGVDALVTYDKFNLQTEYIYDDGDYNKAAGGGCGSEPLTLGKKRQGAYIMAWYNVNRKFQPVLKYEYFDATTDIKVKGYQEMTTLGVNYFFNPKTRLQANYQMRKIDGVTKDNDSFVLQLQVRF